MLSELDRALPCALLFLFSAFAAYASPHSETEHLRYVPSNKLRPISISSYEAPIGLHRRSSEDFSSLDLQTQSELIYGSPGSYGQLLLANMTLYAPDGLMMIMMERFEGLTASVDCKGNDGTMSLTFSSLNAFNYALQGWKYINDNDDGQFLLIANHEGCGPDDSRQPYLISQVTEDSAALTTYLSAKPAPWSDVAGSYDLDFGQAIPYQNTQRTKERSFWGDIENVGKAVLDASTGNADLSKTVNFPMDVGEHGQRMNIYTDDKGRLTLDCIDCFLSGSFAVTGHISVDHFSLQDLTLKGSPQGLQAALQLEATITSSDEPDSLQYTKELFSFPIPDAGIEVEGIFKLGATLSYDVGVSSTFSGSATIDFGLQAGVPDSAQVIANIQNPDSSSATGWGGATLTPLFDIKKESASIKLAAFSQPKLAFGIELIEIGNFDVALTVKLPEISVTVTAAYDADGVCGAGSSITGVKLDSEVDIEVDLQIDAELGDDEDTVKPSWSHTLYAYSIPLGSTCFPLDIPGLNSSSSATTSMPSLPASTLQSMIFTSGISGSSLSSASGSMVGVTGTPSGSMTSNGLNPSTALPALTGTSAPVASQANSYASSGQKTGARPATSALTTNGLDLAPTSSAVTAALLNSVTISRSDPSTTATAGTVPDLDLPNDKLKGVVVPSHTSSSALSSSDIVSVSGLAGGAEMLDLLTPTTLGLVPTASTSIASTNAAVGNGDTYAAVVHSPTSSMPPASSNTFLFSGLSDDHEIFAAVNAESTTIALSSTTLRSNPSIPAALGEPGDKKALVVHPKTTVMTIPKKSSIPSAKPKATLTSSILSPKINLAVDKHVEDLPLQTKVTPSTPKSKITLRPAPQAQSDPTVEKNVQDLPQKPKVIPPPAPAKKPVPVVPTSTSKHVAPASATTPAGGGGGCRRVKRFGKRMLVC